MIFTSRTIRVKQGKSSIDDPIILYRGDFEVEVRFTILETNYRFRESCPCSVSITSSGWNERYYGNW